ncbi:carbohydrate esterase family 3 protein [Karstenula rhodostoma CBS 690.94]|uniref:Carbohydrate esterase family 3 protein n=1 Tax=Karstenula rhodostoma CBS 690.94 TaxID=1392251 RepID=A0A9P4PZ24_9PLEO|nr:carbohydrate esterase family 3 protein [Karstenula rhodostoma CBS 690.94]
MITYTLGLLIPASVGAAALLNTRADAATTVKVMPFGASIVEITCWRAYLWKKLQDSGITNIDFVGSHGTPAAGCTLNGQTVNFDEDNEGHSGAKVTDYANNNSLPRWLSAAEPDMIIMHVGTNDAAANVSTANVFSAYDKLIGQMRTANPRTSLIASKLIPIDPSLFGQSVADKVNDYNYAMEGWVKRTTTAQSPIVLVDLNTGFDYKTMTREGEHPNEKGDVFMAEKLFPKVKDQLVELSVQKLMGEVMGELR